ncbi:MAG: PAS domain S-box protein [Bacteroidota bacterium]
MPQNYTPTPEVQNEEKVIDLDGRNNQKTVKQASTPVSTKRLNLDVLITTQLFDYYPYPLATTDEHSHFIKVNPAFCHFTGYSQHELLHTEMLRLCVKEETAKCLELLQQLRQRELPSFAIPKHYVHKDGRILPALTTVIGHFDEEENYIGSTATVLDLSMNFFNNMRLDIRDYLTSPHAYGNLDLLLGLLCQLNFRDFIDYLKTHHRELTDLDLKHCTFIRLGLNTKTVSKIMHVSHDAVEKARYRLKKKLSLKKCSSLRDFIMGLNSSQP